MAITVIESNGEEGEIPFGRMDDGHPLRYVMLSVEQASIPNDEAFMITISTKIPDINKHIEC